MGVCYKDFYGHGEFCIVIRLRDYILRVGSWPSFQILDQGGGNRCLQTLEIFYDREKIYIPGLDVNV
jgi:hypothetical protein